MDPQWQQFQSKYVYLSQTKLFRLDFPLSPTFPTLPFFGSTGMSMVPVPPCKKGTFGKQNETQHKGPILDALESLERATQKPFVEE
jgi:hypothetical protein